MNRDSLAAFARGIITVLTGGVILYAIGRYLGWYWVAGIAGWGIADSVWCALQLRSWWR